MSLYCEGRKRDLMQVGTGKALIAEVVEHLGKPAERCAVWVSDDERRPKRQNYSAAELIAGVEDLRDHIDMVMCGESYADPVVRIGTYRGGVLIVIDSMLGTLIDE